MRLTVLIKGFYRPALQIQGNNPLGAPVDSIGHQDGIRASQLRIVKAHHQPDFTEPGNTHSERKRPIGFVPYSYGPIRGGGDERDKVFHGNMGSFQSEGLPPVSLRTKLSISK